MCKESGWQELHLLLLLQTTSRTQQAPESQPALLSYGTRSIHLNSANAVAPPPPRLSERRRAPQALYAAITKTQTRDQGGIVELIISTTAPLKQEIRAKTYGTSHDATLTYIGSINDYAKVPYVSIRRKLAGHVEPLGHFRYAWQVPDLPITGPETLVASDMAIIRPSVLATLRLSLSAPWQKPDLPIATSRDACFQLCGEHQTFQPRHPDILSFGFSSLSTDGLKQALPTTTPAHANFRI